MNINMTTYNDLKSEYGCMGVETVLHHARESIRAGISVTLVQRYSNAPTYTLAVLTTEEELEANL